MAISGNEMSTEAWIARYLSRVWKYGISREAVKAGLTCISFFLSLPISGRRSRENHKRLIDYVLLYLLVDYRLDDPAISDQDKRGFLIGLLSGDRSAGAMLSGDHGSIDHGSHVTRLYSRLVTTPAQIELFSTVALTTAESFLVQYDENSTPDELFAVCANKGGQAALVGYRLIYSDRQSMISDDQLLLLGACVQLLDDLSDCSRDRHDGIETIATWCLRVYGYLDHLAIVLVAMALEIDVALTVHRDWLLELINFTVRRSKHYSPAFRERLGIDRYKR